jgi:hypothetical protein
MAVSLVCKLRVRLPVLLLHDAFVSEIQEKISKSGKTFAIFIA